MSGTLWQGVGGREAAGRGAAGEELGLGGAGPLDDLHVVGGVESQLPAVQPPAAPTLLILLAQLGELVS